MIIDDEMPSIKSLVWEIEGLDIPVHVLATCTSPVDAIEKIPQYKPELVFLDIEMPHMNAFEMLSQLPVIDFDIIFTTAYDAYAIKAFEVHAIDYLLKPVEKQALNRALLRFMEQRDQQNISQRLEGLFNTLNKQNPAFPKLALSTMEGLEFVRIDQIVRCESSSNYTYVHTADGKQRLVSKTLGDVEKMLDQHQFHRIHKSHLVNLLYIQKYIRGKTGTLILDDGTSIPVSRQKKEFLEGM